VNSEYKEEFIVIYSLMEPYIEDSCLFPVWTDWLRNVKLQDYMAGKQYLGFGARTVCLYR
jgi:hypothetical protein